ncbi:MAG: domain superfamily [Chloroflexi bacterium]|jgi:uncharacterized protein with GYD domain|nr:domain superfamily [Chloroflexota bacterium]
MPTYILLKNVTEEGAERLKTHPKWIVESDVELEKLGINITAQYAVIGPYDFVTIVEAPDNRTMVQASTKLSMHGNVKITTLPALPLEDFIAALR